MVECQQYRNSLAKHRGYTFKFALRDGPDALNATPSSCLILSINYQLSDDYKARIVPIEGTTSPRAPHQTTHWIERT